MNLVVISGSPRKNSVTVRVAQYLERILGKQTSHNIDIIDLREHELGMIQNVWQKVEDAPAEHQALARTIFNAHAFILVTPEYNGSYSPAMKNLLDHFPKQARKPFGIVTASPGMMGGIRASQQMQQMICAFFGIPSPHMLIVGGVDKKFNDQGELIDEAFQPRIDSFLEEYLWLAENLVD